jgi:hypothetical protein
MPRRLLTVRTGRQPHEIGVLIVSVLVGVMGVATPNHVSPAVADALNGWIIHFYYGGLGFFAVMALWGITKKGIEGLLIERVGLTIVALYYIIFSICVFSYAGFPAGALAASLPIAYALASIVRGFQIRRDLVLIKAYLADHPGEQWER